MSCKQGNYSRPQKPQRGFLAQFYVSQFRSAMFALVSTNFKIYCSKTKFALKKKNFRFLKCYIL